MLDYAAEVAEQHGAGTSVTVADTSGYHFRFMEEDLALREWYLRHGDLLLLVTYCCGADDAGMDDAAVDEILSTLYIKSEQERGGD